MEDLTAGVQGYQLGPQLTKLPPFQLSAAGDLGAVTAAASLADMSLLAAYGRVYCCLICRASFTVKLYRFYKCAS